MVLFNADPSAWALMEVEESLTEEEMVGSMGEEFCDVMDKGEWGEVDGGERALALVYWNEMEEGDTGIAEVRDDTEAVLRGVEGRGHSS